MNYLRIYLLVFSSFIISCEADEQKFGLIATEGKNLCVSFGGIILEENSSITVIGIESSQFSFEAKIGKKTKICKSLEKAQVVGPYFTVTTNEEYESPFLGVAVFGKHKVSKSGEMVFLSVSGSKENIYFRSCASSEGLHFSSWLGRALVGKQLWREYYYLGIDVEPSCEEIDFQAKK